MDCPNCFIAFHDQWENFEVNASAEAGISWTCAVTVCPRCNTPLANFRKLAVRYEGDPFEEYIVLVGEFPAYRITPLAIQVSEHVPDYLARDYKEARAVLPHSPKASAALSRRVLQAMLQERGYMAGNLAQQVDAVLKETDPGKVLPSGIKNSVDAIRNFGNFSAHPITDMTSLQVIDVDPEEAEWCLEIVERLFDHYYVRPANDAEKLAELNAKLGQAGKPPVKS